MKESKQEVKMRKRLVAMVGAAVLVLAPSAMAFRPAGWVYGDYPWAYDGGSGDWMWFNPDTQWVHGDPPAGGWSLLENSGLANGWSFFNWPYAYCSANGSWYYINEVDTQWVVNMGTGVWSLFGEIPVPSDLVLIPAGTNSGADPDFGAYSLTLGSFHIGRHEVTKAMWDEVYTWAELVGYGFDNPGSGKGPDHPVHSVNWYDCVKWCNARGEKEGKRPIYYYTDGGGQHVYRVGQRDLVSISIQPGSPGYALPNANQWEYAARGGVANRRFPWGDSDEIQHARANYYSLSDYLYDTSPTRGVHPDHEIGDQPYTSPAGSFAANGYGVYDIAGNVFEWCWNWHPDYENTHRMIRGGSYGYLAPEARVGRVVRQAPGDTEMVTGFRVVLMPGP
jgi:formylglycine-generating enzyme required for sulfatase activity